MESLARRQLSPARVLDTLRDAQPMQIAQHGRRNVVVLGSPVDLAGGEILYTARQVKTWACALKTADVHAGVNAAASTTMSP